MGVLGKKASKKIKRSMSLLHKIMVILYKDSHTLKKKCLHGCTFQFKVLFKHYVFAILSMYMFMGLVARVVKAMVVTSSSPVGGTGT